MCARLASRWTSLSLALLALAAPLAGATDPLQPAGSGGLPAVERALDHLAHHRRLMVIGAHPDDEDDTLLAVASIGQGTDVAYLSLTRGEGGQNVIGGELGESLGVLRTEELLAGRKVDGARQLFTRAYDFGYTESLTETFARWPREQLLVDVVRAIRRFRPQVVVAVFPGDERAGHGQHAASGALADDALRLAGDALAFPELDGEGLAPWQPELYFREAWRDPQAATLVLPSQGLDPLTGHTLFQIAMEVRSQHRSQSMGQLQDLEARPVRLSHVTAPPEPSAGEPIAGEPIAGTPAAPGSDGLFAGVDTRLTSLARLLPAGPEQELVYARLERVERTIAATRLALAPDRLAASVAPLAEVLRDLREAIAIVAASPSAGSPDGRHLAAFLAEKELVATEALAVAAGLVVDATTAQADVVPGGEVEVTTRLLDGGTTPVRVRSLVLESPAYWTGPVSVPLTTPEAPVAAAAAAPASGAAPTLPVGASTGPPAAGSTSTAETPTPPGVAEQGAEAVEGGLEPVEPLPATTPAVVVGPGGLLSLAGRVSVSPVVSPTAPYFLQHARAGDLYDWGVVPPEVRGEPFEPAPLWLGAELDLLLEGGGDPLPLTLHREVVALSRDLTHGEVRRPLRAVPGVEVSVAQGLLPWPLADTAPRLLQVTLTAHGAPRQGQISVLMPEGWPQVSLVSFALVAGERRTYRVPVAPPPGLTAGRSTLEVGAITDEGARYAESFPLVEYEHVRPRPVPIPSRVAISAFPLVLPRLGKVAYVRGAADEVPEALAAVGVPLDVVPAAELLTRDLGAYDAIVIGPRAYDAAPELAAANPRLLDFVRGGGLLIVQSQRAEYFTQKLAPLPLSMARGNATRTTDETAPVRLLAPDHAVFTTPNLLEATDWEGWVQERGLYYPQEWDAAYVPLLAMADPGKEELTGALLVAPYGQGTFVYTGIAFFRQLPAGVPGAYRLFANLLALARPRVQSEDLPTEGF